MFAKLLVIVDEEVDIRDYPQVWAAVWRHVDPARDLLLCPGPVQPLGPGGGGCRAGDSTLPGRHGEAAR